MKKNTLIKMKAIQRVNLTNQMRKKHRLQRSQGNSIFHSVFIGLTVSGEQAKKKPTPAKKKTAAKTKPAAKPANTRDDWIAKDYDGEAVDTAMEAKPALDTKQEIWDAMLERFKFWMVSLLATSLIAELQWWCRRRPTSLSCQR